MDSITRASIATNHVKIAVPRKLLTLSCREVAHEELEAPLLRLPVRFGGPCLTHLARAVDHLPYALPKTHHLPDMDDPESRSRWRFTHT